MVTIDPSLVAPVVAALQPNSRITLYSRVSDVRQTQGHGLTRQRITGEMIAEALGRSIDERINDPGRSAFFGDHLATGDLGKYLASLDGIPRGSVLLVEDVDRISRLPVTQFTALFVQLMIAGVTVIFYLDDIKIYNQAMLDDNYLNYFPLFMKNHTAREESSKKSARGKKVWSGKRQFVPTQDFSKPFWPLTKRCPAWLEWRELEPSTEKGMFFPILERVEVVQRIFDDLANGLGRDAIARGLNVAGITPWGKGVHWHGGTVQKVTENRAVLGEMQMHTAVHNPKHPGNRKLALRNPVGEPVESYYPAVVTPELWRAAMAVADRRRPKKTSNTGGRIGTRGANMFSGMAVCGACGGPMVQRAPPVRGEAKYKCRWSTEAKCTQRTTFSYDKVEDGILAWARDYAPTIAVPEETKRLEGEVAAILNVYESKKARRRRLIERFGDEDDPQAAEIIDQLKIEIGDLKEQLQRAQHDLDRTRKTELVHRTLIDEMPAKLAAATTHEEEFRIRIPVRESLRSVIQQIKFYPDQIKLQSVGNVLTVFFDVDGTARHVCAPEFGWWHNAERDGPRDLNRFRTENHEENERIVRMYENIDRIQAKFIKFSDNEIE